MLDFDWDADLVEDAEAVVLRVPLVDGLIDVVYLVVFVIDAVTLGDCVADKLGVPVPLRV